MLRVSLSYELFVSSLVRGYVFSVRSYIYFLVTVFLYLQLKILFYFKTVKIPLKNQFKKLICRNLENKNYKEKVEIICNSVSYLC